MTIMNNSKSLITDPEEIINEFQKRQKSVVVAIISCFVVMIPLVIWAKDINPFLSIAFFVVFLIPLGGFYFWKFRCPACNARVQQRFSGLRVKMRCRKCSAYLDRQ